jgi:hypothetical protein
MIANLGISALGIDDYEITPHLLDAWRCTGLPTDAQVIPTAVPEIGGVDLELDIAAVQTGLGANPGSATFDDIAQRCVASTGRHLFAADEAFLLTWRSKGLDIDPGAGHSYIVDMHADAKFRVYINHSSADRATRYACAGVAGFDGGATDHYDGTWRHYVFAGDPKVGSNGTIYIYNDGVAYPSGGGDVMTEFPPSGTSPFTIGSRSTYSAGPGVAWGGQIKDIQWYRTTGSLPSDLDKVVRWLVQHEYRFLPASLWP